MVFFLLGREKNISLRDERTGVVIVLGPRSRLIVSKFISDSPKYKYLQCLLHNVPIAKFSSLPVSNTFMGVICKMREVTLRISLTDGTLAWFFSW